MISDADIEKAVDWLRDSATDTANARADMIKCEHMLHHVKALLMKSHADESLGAQEREAKADLRYLDAIDKLRNATFEFERLRALREAAAARIEAWRSMSANLRGIRL